MKPSLASAPTVITLTARTGSSGGAGREQAASTSAHAAATEPTRKNEEVKVNMAEPPAEKSRSSPGGPRKTVNKDSPPF